MAHQNQIASVDLLRDNSVLISLDDGTAILLTMEQLLHLGGPRIVLAGEESFEQALRRVVGQNA